MPQPDAVDPTPPIDHELRESVPELRTTLALDGIDDVARWRDRPVAPLPSVDQLTRGGAFQITDHRAPSGADVVLCRPTLPSGVAPVLLYVHGGGMIRGTSRSGLLQMVAWAAHLRAAVVSVDYRLAPEHPYPAPHDDCLAGLTWVHEHALSFGLDARRVILVGVSAGGGLAAGTALRVRDEGGPDVSGLMLLGPMLDHRNDSRSVRQMRGHDTWDQRSNAAGWQALLGPAAGCSEVSPYASPGSADNLSGLPPTFVDVGSAETFRDEAVSFAQRIWQQGGEAELHVWAGGFHGYAGHVPGARISQETRRTRLGWLKRQLVVRH